MTGDVVPHTVGISGAHTATEEMVMESSCEHCCTYAWSVCVCVFKHPPIIYIPYSKPLTLMLCYYDQAYKNSEMVWDLHKQMTKNACTEMYNNIVEDVQDFKSRK